MPAVGLNEDQLAAVVHRGSPLLVLAGPGSGKTRLIVHRIAHRLAGELRAEEVVAITFTNRAAAELRHRLDALMGRPVDARVGTFHWMCARILRRHADRAGLPPNFSVLSPRQARALFRDVARELGYVEPGAWQALADAVSTWKNGGSWQAAGGADRIDPTAVQRVAERYTGRLRASRALDLDDLLWECRRMLEQDPELRVSLTRRIGELLVDEYQDTNPVQQAIVHLLAPDGGNVAAVGDDDQSIYGWRQASYTTMASFQRDFPNARIITLAQTYRSSKLILRAAESLIRHNRDRFEKNLRTAQPAGSRPRCYVAQDERDEAEWVATSVSEVRERPSLKWEEIAILYRVNAQARVLEEALVRRQIPYRVLAGRRFLERSEIRLCVAYLRLALDLADDAATRELLERVSGVGPVRVRRLAEEGSSRGLPLSQALAGARAVPAQLAAPLEALASRIRRVHECRLEALPVVLDNAIAATVEDLAGSLSRDELESAVEDIDELRSILTDMPRDLRTLRHLVDVLTLEEPTSGAAAGVNLLSLHAAKGLEFEAVFVT
ncbi:MAG TPA: UvrD-helicase domain-containing protein, partial [Chloroflexota bacterium]|nr:UvrD-helicase domain-containing protein [Chloroflexota bacterium]